MRPLEGGITPDRILSSVDLPAPFSPSRPRISPGRTSSETSLSAVTPEKCLVTPSTASRAGDGGGGFSWRTKVAPSMQFMPAPSALEHPPLSCRTSPPQGGRLAVSPAVAIRSTLEIGESRVNCQSPPLRGRCPAGQRGALSRRPCQWPISAQPTSSRSTSPPCRDCPCR